MNLKFVLLFFISSLALAQEVTVTVVITPSATPSTPDSSASSTSTDSSISSTSTLTPVNNQATTTSQSTLANSISAAAAATSSSSGYSAENGGSNGYYNGGSSGSGSAVDTNAGASGSGGSGGSIGKGGMIAIIVVVVLVAIFGIASTVLFVIAKRRQWNVRASIARASRRMTAGLRTPGLPRTPGFGPSNRRTTINAGRLGGDRRDVDTPRYKRGFDVGMRELDPEKGNVLAGKAPKNTRGREGGWIGRLWGNDWK